MTDQSAAAQQPDPSAPPAYPPHSMPPTPMPPSGYPPVYAFQPRDHPQGTTVLVLGILSFFIGLCAPFAWYIGSKALNEIRASGLRYDNEQQIVIGRLIGLVITVIAIVGVVFALVFLAITGITLAASS